MTELPKNVDIYGFAFGSELSNIDMYMVQDKLKERSVIIEDVIFSAWIDKNSDCVWIIAASRYLDDNEIKDTIDVCVENGIEDEFCLS
jgi:hypothetical protein